MLPVSVVQQIHQLLEAGEISQRKIAIKLGVARGTVSAIANGRRGVHGRETKLDDDQLFNLGPRERCPSCGHLVYLPCVFCRAVDYADRRKEEEALAAGQPTTNQRRPGPWQFDSVKSLPMEQDLPAAADDSPGRRVA